MALLNRLFPSRKKCHKQGYVTFGKNETESWKPFNFSKEQVRVLLFRECDWRVRKLLFDSKTVQKIHLENEPCSKLKFGSRQKCEKKKTDSFVEVTNGFGYQYLRPNSDVTVLGEMIFGSVAMAFQGTVFKVHSMNSPSRFMCTKVFHSPVSGSRIRGISDHSLEDSCGSSINSMSDYFTSQSSCPDTRQASIGSGPVDIELRAKHHYNSLEVDSGYCGDASLQSTSSMGSGGYSFGIGTCASSPDSRRSSGSFLNNPMSCHSGGSLASLQRRWLRNMSTSLELGSQGSMWSSRNAVNELPNEDSSQHGHRRSKLGLAIVISLTPEEEKEMRLFFFEHMTVMEGMMERLHSAVEHAYLHKEMFVHLMMEAYQDVQQWLFDIFSAPRLTSPVWLGLTSGLNHLDSVLSCNFLQDLCHLISNFDTKATNFFVSTLVTAVLTHHLGWVATVLPGKMPAHYITKKPCTGQLLDALSKSHPYNPLWAQLGELYGALGFPTKISKTIVTSGAKKVELLNRILSSLTYFIRCSEVEKRVIEKQDSSDQIGEVNTTANWQPSSVSKATTNVDSRPFHSPFARNLLSGHDVMIVFDSRVDPGVEIGRELKGENGVCPAVIQVNYNVNEETKSASLPFKDIKNHFNSVHIGGEPEEQVCFSLLKSVSTDQLSNESRNANHLKKDVHLSVPQLGGMRRSESFMKKLDTAATETKLEHSTSAYSQGNGRLYPSLADLKLVEDDNRDVNLTLYPEAKSSMTDIQTVEHNRDNNHSSDPEDRCSVADVKVVQDENKKHEFSFHHEQISQKVSRLCRVPTSAILYHLKGEDMEKDGKVEGIFVPKRVESERQRSSAKTAPVFKSNNWPSLETFENSKNISTSSLKFSETVAAQNESKNCENKSGKGDVIFVIGDNERLVDLKSLHKSDGEDNEKSVSFKRKSLGCDVCSSKPSVSIDSSLNTYSVMECDENSGLCNNMSQTNHSSIVDSSLSDGVCLCDIKTCTCGHELDSPNKLKSNLSTDLDKCNFDKEPLGFSKIEQRNGQCTACTSNKNGYKVVTVRPSVIELENECGGLKTDLSVSDSVKNRNCVVQSLSFSCPPSGEKVCMNASLCRRHSDCVCETSRYLKDYHSVRFHFERCEGVLMNYIEGRDQKKSLHCTDKKTDKVTEARGNFSLTESPAICEKCSCMKKNAVSFGSSAMIDKTNDNCDTSLVREEKYSRCGGIVGRNGYVSEGNALFEDYGNLSDDDILSEARTSSRIENEEEATSTEQQQCESLLELPIPRYKTEKHGKQLCGFAASLMGSTSDHYIPDMVLQGCMQLPKGWEANLRRDLSLTAHHPLLDQEISEAVCIVADIDTWEVQLVSSHTYVVDKPGTLGIRVGMSRLVANMLESLLYLWRLKTPPEHCLLHLESKLRELFLRSQALAELLLTTEFCDMELLTTSLDLDANDVPLLLAVASTHTPQVTERYGLSFR